MHHTRKTYTRYKKRNKADTPGVCTLCVSVADDTVVEESETMRVIKNRVPYDMFEGVPTTGDHLMIVPRRHAEQFHDFTPAEKLDHMELIAKYEAEGYNVYARSQANIHRSQPHQHTHLIKLSTRQPKVLFTVHKPYLLLYK